YAVAPDTHAYPVGDLDYELAAFIEPISCVVYGLKRLRIPVGASALIYGAGPIGLLMLQLVDRGGAGGVTMVDLKQDKLELAQRLGASDAVLASSDADEIGRASCMERVRISM